MAGQFCSHCGGQNPPGAAFCQYCGSAMATSASAPLPPSGPTPPPIPAAAPPSWGPSGYSGGAQAPRRRPSALRIVAIVIVVVLMIAILAYLLLPTSSPAGPVDVTLIAFQSADNTCGLDGIEYYGFNASLSSSVSLEFAMNNSNASAAQCTIHTVATTTPGFSIGGASPLPCVIPASETVTWTLTVNVPSSDYTGVLTLVVT